MSTSVVHVRRRPTPFLLSAICLFLLCAAPLSALAEDERSIATLRQMGKAFASIAEKASPAVVGVQAEKKVASGRGPRDYYFGDPRSPFDEDLFKYFFGPRTPRRYEQPESRQVARGSGFIISRDGYILTNNHVVGDAVKVTVSLDDGEKHTAEIVGVDPETDVAVIKIDKDNLPYVQLADSDALEVGEWVIAIGNPFGLSHTVTAGIVSAKGRSGMRIANYEDFIQTDAAINFGNSGGPLLNLDGRAVGINTAIIGPGGNVGIGLAIPSNMAKDIYRQLKESGTVVRGFLGVGIEDVTPENAEFFDLEEARGVLITQVTEDSGAEKAGMKRGDVVLKFEGQPVDSANDFRNRVAMYKPGTKVELVFLRDGKQKTLKVTLGERPAGLARGGPVQIETRDRLGITVQTLTDELAQRLGYEGLSGVLVTEVEPGSEAGDKGIQRGSLIREVDRKEIDNVREFNDAIEKAQERGKALLLVRYEDFDRYVVVDLTE
jgi:serine protease Do